MLNVDYAKAITIFQGIVKQSPDPAMKSKANAKLGICYFRQKNNGQALAAYSQVDEKYLDDRDKVKMASLAIQASDAGKEDLNKKAYYYTVLNDVYGPLSESEISNRYGAEAKSKADVNAKFKEASWRR